MDRERDHLRENEEFREMLGRFENMLQQAESWYFDVYEFERIIDHYLDTNHFTKAIDAVEHGFRQHPGSTTLLIKEAQVYAEKGESNIALGMVQHLEKLEQSNGEVFMLKGMILNQLGKVSEAEEAFTAALELNLDNKVEILYDIALSFEYVNQFKIAVKYLEKAHRLQPEKLATLYELAYCHDRLHDFDRSIRYYEIYLDIEPFAENAWYNLGLLYLKKENFAKSVECFDFSIAINDQYSAAVFNKANALANLGEFDKAIESYKECILLEPENVLAHCYLGEALEKGEAYEEAIQWYEKATRIDPDFSESWYGIGVCYLFRKLYPDALFYVKKALTLDTENPDFWFTLGNIQAHLGEHADAMHAYTRTTELDPYDEEAWINLAKLRFKKGSASRAIQVLKDSYTHTFDVALVNYHLAAYNYLERKHQLALQFYEKGLKLDVTGFRAVLEIAEGMLEEPEIKALIEKYLGSRISGKRN